MTTSNTFNGKFNYGANARKFLAAKLEASFITVELWDNDSREYKYVGEVVFERHGLTGFIYDDDYNGPPLDPAGLDYRKHGRTFVSSRNEGALKKYFANLLPGIFGNKILQSHDSKWMKLREVQKIAVLATTHAEFDAIRLNAYLGKHDQYIVGIEQLDKIVQKIVAYSAKELTTILDDENRAALTNLKGRRGKADYVHDDGRRFVAKPALKHDTWNMVRMEHAMGELASSAGIDAVKSKVITLPSGNEVYMSLRYDQAQGIKNSPGAREFKMEKQYNRIAMKAILIQDPAMRGKDVTSATYVDIKNALTKYSDKPIKDIEELYARTIYHVGINNRDNNLGNFEMYLDDLNDWRLAPSYDVLPDPETSEEFSVMITAKYTSGENTPLTLSFLDEIATEFGIDPERGRVLATPVLEAVANASTFLQDAGVSEYDAALVAPAIRSEEANQLIGRIAQGEHVHDTDSFSVENNSGTGLR